MFKHLSAPAVNKINQKSQQQVKKAIRNAWLPILRVEMGLECNPRPYESTNTFFLLYILVLNLV